MTDNPIHIMMVAGEHSGDILGAGLIRCLKERYPNAKFSGIGGQRMIAEGFESSCPMSKLSVFGLFEVLKHLPELLGIRKQLRQSILNVKPDVFIGIDAPDFNLKLERDIHQFGIKTVHYVSPTVWAWRPKRIKKLIGSLNALLCIFPFEEKYFENTPVPAYFIGHPLADKYSGEADILAARKNLGIDVDAPVLTIMPGSRIGELNRHSLLFIQAAKIFANKIPGLQVLLPMPDEKTATLFNEIYANSAIKLDIKVAVMASSLMISASDSVLVASGTATLEVMLFKKPMVVAYKLSALTAWVFKTFDLLKAPFVSMPNLIAGKQVVREFIQDDAKAELLAAELINIYRDPKITSDMVNQFSDMKINLTRDADNRAADIVSRVINGEI
ncbi:MAG: lipid-A-disaccharide synthase [Cycloclasticus sp.]|nr:MAG: lipid-A-disaccharide synthase [Cycloclasticus sp.]